MKSRAALLLALAVPALAGCATAAAAPGSQAHASYPEASPFTEGADATRALDAALASAGEGRRVLAVFGANWCHDSRALAGWLQSPAIAPFVAQHYAVVYIDVGVPQTGEGRNLALAARHGVSDVTGTPTLLVLEADGTLLNSPADARAWRNAASRSEGDIRAFLRQWAKPAA